MDPAPVVRHSLDPYTFAHQPVVEDYGQVESGYYGQHGDHLVLPVEQQHHEVHVDPYYDEEHYYADSHPVHVV